MDNSNEMAIIVGDLVFIIVNTTMTLLMPGKDTYI